MSQAGLLLTIDRDKRDQATRNILSVIDLLGIGPDIVRHIIKKRLTKKELTEILKVTESPAD